MFAEHVLEACPPDSLCLHALDVLKCERAVAFLASSRVERFTHIIISLYLYLLPQKLLTDAQQVLETCCPQIVFYCVCTPTVSTCAGMHE